MNSNITYFFKEISTPVGKLKLIGSERGLYAVLWENEAVGRVRLPALLNCNDNYPLFLETEQQLSEYFKGTRQEFSLPLELEYGTEFQRSAWNALKTIPYGQTRTYLEQAALLGNIKSSRAVGSANGKNPISIIVPCHRVIASDGSLGGFAGGLKIKQLLLDIEREHSQVPTFETSSLSLW